MPESITLALQELIKASPYAGLVVLVVWIINHFHFKQMKMNQDTANKAIEEIRNAYSDVSDKLPQLYERIMDRSDANANDGKNQNVRKR